MITKEELHDMKYWLTFAREEVIVTQNKDRIDSLIDKIEDELDEGKPSIDSFIQKLRENKQKIYDGLIEKHKNRIPGNMESIIEYLNKEEPALMVQLFFLDMELKNLGYD